MNGRPKASNKEVEALLKACEEQGATVELRRGGHFVVRPPDKNLPQVVVPATPSDRRSLKNSRAVLRRCGFKLP